MEHNKKYIIVVWTLLLSLSLTGCKSTDYANAKTAINEQDYETALKLLNGLEDYKDCQELLVENINTYVDLLVNDNRYEDALNTLDLYNNVSDFSNLYSEIQGDKELYDLYSQAKECFADNKISDGFNILDTLPKDYKNVQNIYDSYNVLKDSGFTGTHSNTPSSSTPELKQQVKFETIFSSDKFQLHVYKKVYWSDDGTISAQHDFYIDADEINGNTIKYGSYTWTMENGRLTEIEKSQTYKYN